MGENLSASYKATFSYCVESNHVEGREVGVHMSFDVFQDGKTLPFHFWLPKESAKQMFDTMKKFFKKDE